MKGAAWTVEEEETILRTRHRELIMGPNEVDRIEGGKVAREKPSSSSSSRLPLHTFTILEPTPIPLTTSYRPLGIELLNFDPPPPSETNSNSFPSSLSHGRPLPLAQATRVRLASSSKEFFPPTMTTTAIRRKHPRSINTAEGDQGEGKRVR